jgi:hypothetical protein
MQISHSWMIVVALAYCSIAGRGQTVELFENHAGQGEAVTVRIGGSMADLGEVRVSSIGLPDDETVAILYRDEGFRGVGLVVVGKGIHNLGGEINWNDAARSIRVFSLNVGEHLFAFIRTLSSILRDDPDSKYDLRLLPAVQAAAKAASHKFAQGNQGAAHWETCLLDLKGNTLTMKLWIRHRHDWGRHLGRAYSCETSPEVTINLAPFGFSTVRLDLGRGIMIDPENLFSLLGLKAG